MQRRSGRRATRGGEDANVNARQNGLLCDLCGELQTLDVGIELLISARETGFPELSSEAPGRVPLPVPRGPSFGIRSLHSVDRTGIVSRYLGTARKERPSWSTHAPGQELECDLIIPQLRISFSLVAHNRHRCYDPSMIRR
ncbi:hypothetical protein DTO166G4_666 [Paecilomyces variotii]|nr:hypothetical protein DTO166G4_666 [Paecilomyces variotii]KAJ9238870.1 hypothetical protein DTO166G5_2666 [Paecilomyces variotii]KAJ9247417.1 hypothetical protein DTO207G8_8116 [Paecilomyces variotii]KAJ9304470.1 hypothetical protein DTO217A2_6078 [Paecilomyces variotii]KAJ9378179.1 hypothetical protein DTO063F5_7878 [Paecilomyces variotii]